MNVLTILGTRPEIIRLSRIIPKLDLSAKHTVLHTGQNFDPLLSNIFYYELGIRKPDIQLDSKSETFAQQLSKILTGVESALSKYCPDKVLVLGDTNSGLSAIVCARYGVPVYHMEAGNRCYDLKVPEEVNRRLIDSVSSVNMPYTRLSRENLLREGIPNNSIYVTGNPILEVLNYYTPKIDLSDILVSLGLETKKYILVTAHRTENVDNEQRLKNIFTALSFMAKDYKIVFSCHPRTREKLKKFAINIHPNIIVGGPWGFFDFVKLEKNCKLAVTDSGTVQEEMCILNIPSITVRDTTERPETVWCGSNVVCGLEVNAIMSAYSRMIEHGGWTPPSDYLKSDVSDTVVNILLSK